MRWMVAGTMLAVSLASQAVAQSAVAQSTVAQSPAAEGDAQKGLSIARTWCAACHVVEENPARAVDGAATFPAIAARPAVTADGLRAFLSGQHSGAAQGRMPNLSLSRNDVENLVAYILSLRGT